MNTLNSGNTILGWAPAKVVSWLHINGLRGYEEKFIENSVSGEVLVRLNAENLKDLGIKNVGDRLNLLKAIHQLKRSNDISFENGDFEVFCTICAYCSN